MSKKINIDALKRKTAVELDHAWNRYEATAGLDYPLRRWVAAMTAVEMHAIWERYAERRLIAALNHNPKHFLSENNITGVFAVSTGFAQYVVRAGARFFDFRSMSDLITKAKRWLGPAHPFSGLVPKEIEYLDCLAAIRNCVVHRSEASAAGYKRNLRTVYGLKFAPTPQEFLHAKDFRKKCPAPGNPRLYGLYLVIAVAVKRT